MTTIAMNEITRLIEIANDRLRKGKVGVSLELQGRDDWIYVRGTFPPKAKSQRSKPYQQRIALGLRANSREAVKYAEVTARQIGLDLNLDNFDWAKFDGSEAEPNAGKLAHDWMVELEKWFWSNRVRDASTENTWRVGYQLPLRRLTPDRELTTELLVDWVIENSTPRSRRRGQYCTCARELSRLAGLPTEVFRELAAGYSKKSVNPRNLPSDEVISQTWQDIGDPGWRFLFGLMSAYGLRNHECFGIDLTDFPVIRVRKCTKTGERAIKPLYPEWAERWELNRVIYPRRLAIPEDISGIGNAYLGAKITRHFKESIGWSPYNLRHSYARRCAENDIPPAIAARLMGHSLKEHEETYKAWIGEKHYLDAVDRALERNRTTSVP